VLQVADETHACRRHEEPRAGGRQVGNHARQFEAEIPKRNEARNRRLLAPHMPLACIGFGLTRATRICSGYARRPSLRQWFGRLLRRVTPDTGEPLRKPSCCRRLRQDARSAISHRWTSPLVTWTPSAPEPGAAD
jgi:hypothetical protein